MRYLLLLLTCAVTICPALAQGVTNMTGLTSHPCVLVNADMLPLLRAKTSDANPTRFGFKTADTWNGIKARADALAQLPPYHYRVACPGENNVILDPFHSTLPDEPPPKHEKSPSYPPWTAMFQEREDSITPPLVHFSFAYLVTG